MTTHPTLRTDLTCPYYHFDDGTLHEVLPPVEMLIQHAARASYRPPRFDLGLLDAFFPNELILEIIARFDICTFDKFAQVNKRAREMVQSLLEYQTIIHHAPLLMVAIRVVDLTPWVTYRSLYQKLCSHECEECGDFSGLLYMPTCTRICMNCLPTSKQCRPVTIKQARAIIGLNTEALKKLLSKSPYMKIHEHRYAPGFVPVEDGVVFNWDDAIRAGVEMHGSFDKLAAYIKTASLHELGSRNPEARTGRILAIVKRAVPHSQKEVDLYSFLKPPICDSRFKNTKFEAYRFAATVRIPWFDKASREARWGWHCAMCAHFGTYSMSRRMFIGEASFREHLREHLVEDHEYGSTMDESL